MLPVPLMTKKAAEDETAGMDPDQKRIYFTNNLNPQPNNEIIDSWEAYTLADAYQKRDPIKYVAGNIFEQASLNIVYGAPGTLKSFLLADLLVCVAAGKPWLQPAPWQNQDSDSKGILTIQTPGMWLDFDNGRRRTLDRFSMLGHGHNLLESLPIVIYSMPNPWLLASDRLSIDALIKRVKTSQAGLVVIDNLGTVLGDAEENAAVMASVMRNFRRLAEDSGAVVILIHHQRKSNGNLKARAGDALRGHSSIEAALDLALRVEREPGRKSINIVSTKTRGIEVTPFSAEFTFDENEQTAQFYDLTVEDLSSDKSIECEILNVLSSISLNKTELTKTVKEALPDAAINNIRDAIARLAETKISKSKGKSGGSIYSYEK
jgi:hypothetical protein